MKAEVYLYILLKYVEITGYKEFCNLECKNG